MKKCFKCGTCKPITDFYAHAAMADGRLNKCNDCTKADVTAHRLANIDRVRAYDALRAAMPHRVAARKDYQQTPEGRASHGRALKASAARFPDRSIARIKLGIAVRDGRVRPWPVCAVHTCRGKPEGHHADYAAPLAVTWLCNAHHRAAHAISKALDLETP